MVKYTLNNEKKEDTFDTVMLAIGRYPDTKNLGLEDLGIKVNEKNNKIIADDNDKTNIDNIYAIGDCVDTRLELTPTAIKAGKLLVRRLYDNKSLLMDYKYVATTVFTPLEYGCIGYSEEDAIQKHGEENLTIFVSKFKPLEWALSS